MLFSVHMVAWRLPSPQSAKREFQISNFRRKVVGSKHWKYAQLGH